MKRPVLLLAALIALVLLMAGCAEKAMWKPLFDSPDPNRTSSIKQNPSGSAAPDGQGKPGEENELFATEVEAMETPRIIIYKSKHVLEVWEGETLMARMQVAIGRTEGAKQKSGDSKTPEGQYYICQTSDAGRYYKSLFLSYPNSSDAHAALEEEDITEKQYDDIVYANDHGHVPPWNTSLGGEIAISGTGTAGKDKVGDWTAGAVAVSDKDMDYLYKYIKIGVDVEINP